VTDVVVLGAGPAGLGAAYRLALSGRRVVVLERASAVGGLAASFEVGGLRVDHGSHRLHPSTAPEILAVLRSLLGDELQLRRRNGRIRLAGRFVRFPPRAGDLLRHLPPGLAVRLAADLVGAPLRRRGEGSFSAVVRSTLGPTMSRAFYEPYVRKIFGVEGHELSAELAQRRISARSSRDLVRRALGRAGHGTFLYPAGGFGRIVEVLARAAVEAGAQIRTDAEVVEVRVDDEGAEVTLASGVVVAGAQVWSTLPLPVLARLAGAPAYVASAAERLEHRALALVYLVLDRPVWTEYDAHSFPEPDVLASRISEPKRYRESPSDPGDATVLCAEVPCSVGDEVWRSADDELGARVAADVERAGLPAVTPVEVVVRRVPRAYPVYRVGFEDELDHLDGWAARLPNLLTFGRQGLFAHDNTHHALAMAWAAVDALDARGRPDPARWAAARERFRDHVVED
jgi:protoporphyrinogen oxidase